MATLIILAVVVMLVATVLVAGGLLDGSRRARTRTRSVVIDERPVRRVRRVVEDVAPVVTRPVVTTREYVED